MSIIYDETIRKKLNWSQPQQRRELVRVFEQYMQSYELRASDFGIVKTLE
jgi:hypothetical protein